MRMPVLCLCSSIEPNANGTVDIHQACPEWWELPDFGTASLPLLMVLSFENQPEYASQPLVVITLTDPAGTVTTINLTFEPLPRDDFVEGAPLNHTFQPTVDYPVTLVGGYKVEAHDAAGNLLNAFTFGVRIRS